MVAQQGLEMMLVNGLPSERIEAMTVALLSRTSHGYRNLLLCMRLVLRHKLYTRNRARVRQVRLGWR